MTVGAYRDRRHARFSYRDADPIHIYMHAYMHMPRPHHFQKILTGTVLENLTVTTPPFMASFVEDGARRFCHLCEKVNSDAEGRVSSRSPVASGTRGDE